MPTDGQPDCTYWQTHKVNCRAKNPAFVFPPLAQDEVDALLFVHETEGFSLEGAATRGTMLEYLKAVGLYGGELSGLVSMLSKDAPPNRRRSILLILIRNYLYDAFARPHLRDHPSGPQFNAWHGVSAAAVALVKHSIYGDTSFKKEGEPLELGKKMLEEILVAYTLLHDLTAPGQSALRLVKLNFERALVTIQAAPLREEVKSALVQLETAMSQSLDDFV
ncbi:hypothetical protein JCM11641_001006 [Rhodosporidiobolus odoratus]